MEGRFLGYEYQAGALTVFLLLLGQGKPGCFWRRGCSWAGRHPSSCAACRKEGGFPNRPGPDPGLSPSDSGGSRLSLRLPGQQTSLQDLSQLLHGNPPPTLGSSRIAIWQEALELGLERPALGSGPDTYQFRSSLIFTRELPGGKCEEPAWTPPTANT